MAGLFVVGGCSSAPAELANGELIHSESQSISAYVLDDQIIFYAGCKELGAKIINSTTLELLPTTAEYRECFEDTGHRRLVDALRMNYGGDWNPDFRITSEHSFVLDGLEFRPGIIDWVTPPNLPSYSIGNIQNNIPVTVSSSETHTLTEKEYGVEDFERAGLSASAFVSGNTVIFYAGGCDTFTATILSNSELSEVIVNPMSTVDNDKCDQDNESTVKLQEHLNNVSAGLGTFHVLDESGFMLDGIKFGFAIYDWVTPPALPNNFFRNQFEISDITDLITDEYRNEIVIPSWTQASDGSITLFINGPQAIPAFIAFSPRPVPLSGELEVLVVEEGWTPPIAELSRLWAFSIRGADGQAIFPIEVQFIRYDGLHEMTVIPKTN